MSAKYNDPDMPAAPTPDERKQGSYAQDQGNPKKTATDVTEPIAPIEVKRRKSLLAIKKRASASESGNSTSAPEDKRTEVLPEITAPAFNQKTEELPQDKQPDFTIRENVKAEEELLEEIRAMDAAQSMAQLESIQGEVSSVEAELESVAGNPDEVARLVNKFKKLVKEFHAVAHHLRTIETLAANAMKDNAATKVSENPTIPQDGSATLAAPNPFEVGGAELKVGEKVAGILAAELVALAQIAEQGMGAGLMPGGKENIEGITHSMLTTEDKMEELLASIIAHLPQLDQDKVRNGVNEVQEKIEKEMKKKNTIDNKPLNEQEIMQSQNKGVVMEGVFNKKFGLNLLKLSPEENELNGKGSVGIDKPDKTPGMENMPGMGGPVIKR